MIDFNFILCFTLCFFVKTSAKGDSLWTGMCRSQSDCGANHCCAMQQMRQKYGFCMPTKDLGDLCTPSYLYGRSYTCGCKQGLTCALVERNERTNRQKYRCVQVLPEAKEIHESNKKLTETKTNLITAEELARLLKNSNHKPKLKLVKKV